ncbi:MAG: rRNA pseudouridine synthase [Bdellovibrionales bacterium]|nr:rRNA pseudouridine synthase [Bdellovibrionales bacterium]
MSDRIRLSKRLADLGICSRREADDLISQGLVLVNGEVCDVLGTKVTESDTITLSSKAKRQLDEKVTIVLHKPVGYVSGQAEDGYIPAIRLITEDSQYGDNKKPLHRYQLKGLAPVGRLDIDSKGLLLLTQDGVLARSVIGEKETVEKEYVVKLDADLTEKEIKRLSTDFVLDQKKLKPVKITKMRDGLYQFILIEGKKRQIRRMVESVGKTVLLLKRIRIGKLELGDLPEGKWRFLEKSEKI